MYSVLPVDGRPNSAASLTRWASPADSVGATLGSKGNMAAQVAEGV